MIYKERASQIGAIMTNPRSKSETLSKTAKTRIQEKFLFDRFGIKKDVWSKYTDKGIKQEGESINLFSKVWGLFGIKKNERSFENDWFTGTPDIITDTHIIDIKTSWDGTTFPFFQEEVENKFYVFQLQAYMHLTGLKNALLVYCLTDADEQMILDETRRKCWQNGIIDFDNDPEVDRIEEEVRKQLTFGHIPDELRIKVFEVDYNSELVESMIERVELCRDYYNELTERINNKLESVN